MFSPYLVVERYNMISYFLHVTRYVTNYPFPACLFHWNWGNHMAVRILQCRWNYGVKYGQIKRYWNPLKYNINKNRGKHCVYLHSLRAKFFRGNINICLHFMSFLHTDKTQIIEIPIRHSQYHGCWCPGDERSQGISNYDIYLINIVCFVVIFLFGMMIQSTHTLHRTSVWRMGHITLGPVNWYVYPL